VIRVFIVQEGELGIGLLMFPDLVFEEFRMGGFGYGQSGLIDDS
jgi:hypothetical protein